MKTKVIGAAVAAALLGLSAASFGQSAAGSGSAASPQDTPREAGAATAGSGSNASGAVISPGTTVTTPGTTVSRCDNMTGAARTRCMRDERASQGSSTTPGVPVTQQPAQSGVGAVDKEHPGQEPAGRNAANPRDAGTSSAGSGGK